MKKTYGNGPGRVTLELPSTWKRLQADEVARPGLAWHYCPRCGKGVRIATGNSCFCQWDEETGSWMPTPLVLAKDQAVAEAAYRLGGPQAVGQLFAQELPDGE